MIIDRVCKIHNKRLRVPMIMQMTASECGAASLAMILAYHKKRIPLDEIREVCSMNFEGTTAKNIITAA